MACGWITAWRLCSFTGCAAIVCAVIGCQTPAPAAPLTEDVVRNRWLGWVTDGRTLRQDVVRQLGEPTRTYEEGRIVAYHLYLCNPRRDVTAQNFRSLHARGFGNLEPDTQLHALHPAAPPQTHLRKYLSPATFGLVLVYDGGVVRSQTLLRSAP